MLVSVTQRCKPAQRQKTQSTCACHNGKLRSALLPMTGRLPCGRGAPQKSPEASDFSTVVTKSLALVASTNIRTTSSRVQPKGLANKLATAVALGNKFEAIMNRGDRLRVRMTAADLVRFFDVPRATGVGLCCRLCSSEMPGSSATVDLNFAS